MLWALSVLQALLRTREVKPVIVIIIVLIATLNHLLHLPQLVLGRVQTLPAHTLPDRLRHLLHTLLQRSTDALVLVAGRPLLVGSSLYRLPLGAESLHVPLGRPLFSPPSLLPLHLTVGRPLFSPASLLPLHLTVGRPLFSPASLLPLAANPAVCVPLPARPRHRLEICPHGNPVRLQPRLYGDVTRLELRLFLGDSVLLDHTAKTGTADSVDTRLSEILRNKNTVSEGTRCMRLKKRLTRELSVFHIGDLRWFSDVGVNKFKFLLLFNIEPNNRIFDVSTKTRPHVTNVKTPCVVFTYAARNMTFARGFLTLTLSFLTLTQADPAP